MSQSDYIEYKKRATELKEQTKLPPILSGDDYCAFKQFSLENTVINTKQTNNQLIPPNTKIIFDSPIFKLDCSGSKFICGQGTQARPNRQQLSQVYIEPKQPSIYVKHPKIVCSNCCTDTVNSIHKQNINTLFTLCRINRLKNKLCLCAV